MNNEQICIEFQSVSRQRLVAVAAKRRITSLLALGVLTLSGCSEKQLRDAPPTYPVRGQLKVRSGPLPVGGCVEFKPNDNEDELTAMGVIDNEGKFSLSIPFVDRLIPGATAGPHRAYVVMPLDAASRKAGGRVSIPGVFTVLPEDENDFTITMPTVSR